MKIAFFEASKIEEEFFKELFPNHDVVFTSEKLNKDNINLAIDADIISVFCNSEVLDEIIKSLPNLKFISTRSTGYDHIDLNSCENKGIKISNVPAYGSHTVAEFTFALILNLTRKVYMANDDLREDGNFDISSFKGFDLRGKTLGVVGTGKIGKNVVKIAKGFEMNVIAYDPYPNENFAKENNFKYKNFDKVITEADIITLHAPYCKENHHLLNKENIAKMKKGVFIINAARGELIDNTALLWGVKEGIVAGAGLDVLEGERDLKEEAELITSGHGDRIKDYKVLSEDHILIDLPNVIVTPHIAFYSVEAEKNIMKTTEENIKGFISGEAKNLVADTK